jgi:hypothetical protein
MSAALKGWMGAMLRLVFYLGDAGTRGDARIIALALEFDVKVGKRKKKWWSFAFSTRS